MTTAFPARRNGTTATSAASDVELAEGGRHPGGWDLVETKADFEALTQDPTPRKVLGVAQAATTLQQKTRQGLRQTTVQPPDERQRPDLGHHDQSGINCLDDNPRDSI